MAFQAVRRCITQCMNHGRQLSSATSPGTYMYSSSGMNFELSPEQREIYDTAIKFSQEVIVPQAKYFDQRSEFSWELTRKMWEMGYSYVFVNENYGGVGSGKWGLGVLGAGLIMEAVAYGCAAQCTTIAANCIAHLALIHGANEEQKKKYLGRVTEEPMITATCVTEPQGGSDVSATRLKAEKKGDHYVLNGNKQFISNAGEANWYYVLARTSAEASAGKALTGFIVEADTPGISVGKKERQLGIRASDTRAVIFEDVLVPKENVVGGEGAGFGITMKAFDYSRPNVAFAATGVTSRALEESLKYSLERKVFGKKIIEHQAIGTMIAQMACSLEASRYLTYRGAWGLDMEESSPYFVSLSKAFAAEEAVKSATNAVQILGGAGFNEEYPVEKLMRDSKIFTIYEGTTQIQHMIIIRELVKKLAEGTHM